MLAALVAGHATAAAATITIACGAVGREFELCKSGAEAWARATGNEVVLVSTPNESNERLALYQQLLAARSPDIDAFQIDVIWPGILGEHFIDLRPFVSDEALSSHFPAIVENDTVNGRLVALPWFVDAGLLYYRKDLLERYGERVPETWDELTATAGRIQDAERAAGNPRMAGFVFQGRPYEGLTCNALEWVASFGGGALIKADGRIDVANPRAVRALELAASWVGAIAPKGVLNYAEEEARGVFQSGNAVFMRNWPYAWALANSPDSPVKGKVGVVPLPRGGEEGRPAGTLGGWQLAVSRYSRHPEVAAELVVFLTSENEQKRRAIEASYNPTIAGLYKDPDVLAANPFMGRLYDVFVNAVARPSRVTGAKYNRVSAAFWDAVHAVLRGKEPAVAALAALERRLDRIGGPGRW
ncbi:MAG: ABC transporter substrate-binding protein [Alphaproteobacteria bacterium]